MKSNIECPKCGQENNVDKNSNSRLICTECWTYLDQDHDSITSAPSYENAKSVNKKGFLLPKIIHVIIKNWFFWIVILIFAFNTCSDSRKERKAIRKKDSHARRKLPIYHTVAKPSTGIVLSKFNAEKIAPFKVLSSSGDDYYIKLSKWNTDETVLTAYVHGGETLKIKVPIGKYKIKYASGEIWYGEKNLFGEDTSYSMTIKPIEFKLKGQQIMGASITLYKVRNGNLRSKKLNAEDF